MRGYIGFNKKGYIKNDNKRINGGLSIYIYIYVKNWYYKYIKEIKLKCNNAMSILIGDIYYVNIYRRIYTKRDEWIENIDSIIDDIGYNKKIIIK